MNKIRSSCPLASLFVALMVLSALPVRAQQGMDDLIRRGEVAGLDEALLRTVDQRASENGLGPAERSAILSKGVELAELGLPAEAVLHKALEGLAKQVPTPTVVSVLERMKLQTIQAGRIIDTWLERPDAGRLIVEVRSGSPRGKAVLVENLAEALVHDVPRPTIDAVLDRLPEQARRSEYNAAEVGTALGVLADLPSTRQDPEATADLVVSALNAGYSPAEIRRLPLAMKAAEQRGAPSAETAHEVAREIMRGTPAEDVLQGLFGGEFPGKGVGPGGQGAKGGPPGSKGPPPGVGPDDVERGRGNKNKGRRGRNS